MANERRNWNGEKKKKRKIREEWTGRKKSVQKCRIPIKWLQKRLKIIIKL